jgi:RNA polymerase sigma-70 factor (ECF subfamily)
MAGDTYASVRSLYDAAYRRLVGVVALAAESQQDAEECVQEAFMRLLPRWQTVSRYDDPEAWVRLVAVRLLANRRRRVATGLRVLHRHGVPPHIPAANADTVDISRALAALPLPHRQVVVLHHLLQMSVTEIASTLGVPTGTVKSRLSRARAALAPLLREETFRASS